MRPLNPLKKVIHLALLCAAGAGLATSALCAVEADPAAVLEAKSGAREEVNLGWWPNLFPDATAALQEALDCKARRVIIPNSGKPYVVDPIMIQQSDLEIIFEPGVEVRAKSGGAYANLRACLFSIRGVKNVTLRGNGATLRMNRSEYPRKPHSEWRHGIRIDGCENVLVEGLTVRETGGDGIYISYFSPPLTAEETQSGAKGKIIQSRNITIRNVRSIANHRQGLSLISGENIVIEKCSFEETAGAPPQAGIDIEPGNDLCVLKNIVVRDCIAKNNAGSGFMVYLGHLKKTGPPVSVRFENCRVEGGTWGLIAAAVGEEDGVTGSVLFKECSVKGTQRGGIYIYDKAASGAEAIFEACTFEDVAKQEMTKNTTVLTPDEGANNVVAALRPPPQAPIVFYLRRRPGLPTVETIGGVKFIRCTVKDSKDRPLIASDAAVGAPRIPIASVTGEITTSSGKVLDVAQLLGQ